LRAGWTASLLSGGWLPPYRFSLAYRSAAQDRGPAVKLGNIAAFDDVAAHHCRT
jgi:hypothetical protein